MVQSKQERQSLHVGGVSTQRGKREYKMGGGAALDSFFFNLVSIEPFFYQSKQN